MYLYTYLLIYINHRLRYCIFYDLIIININKINFCEMNLLNYIKHNKFGYKDLVKFENCTKLISRGCLESSSASYAKHPMANTGIYSSDDIVGISVNGSRANRITFDEIEVLLAIRSHCTIITDSTFDRNRSFNLGERELANFLTNNSYKEISDGVWEYTIY